MQINQSGHQVQVLLKISVRNNVLCIGHSVWCCGVHTYIQTSFRLNVYELTDELRSLKEHIKKRFYESTASQYILVTLIPNFCQSC